jgi:hypothetical protein
MTTKKISGFFCAGLCMAVFLMAVLMGSCAADQSSSNLFNNNAPQTAQERENLFKAFQNMGENSASQVAQITNNPYNALQNPYAFTDPQAGLEQTNAYRTLQKLNSKLYQDPSSPDNWYYWSNIWLNGDQENSYGANAYNAMDNPYAFANPQAGLEQTNTYRTIQKLNSKLYQDPSSPDNWYYWSNMWLNAA